MCRCHQALPAPARLAAYAQLCAPFPAPPTGKPRHAAPIQLADGKARVQLGKGMTSGCDLSSLDNLLGHLTEILDWRLPDFGQPMHLVRLIDAIATRLADVGGIVKPTFYSDEDAVNWLLLCRNNPKIVEAVCAAVGGDAGMGMWSRLYGNVNATSRTLVIDAPTKKMTEAIVDAGLGTSAPLFGSPGDRFSTPAPEYEVRGMLVPDTLAMRNALDKVDEGWPTEGRDGEGKVEVIESDIWGQGLVTVLLNVGLGNTAVALLRASKPSHPIWPYGAGSAQRRHPLAFQCVWWAVVRERFFVRKGGDSDDPDGYWAICYALVCLAALSGRAVVLRNGPFAVGGGLRIGVSLRPYHQGEAASAAGLRLGTKWMARVGAHFLGKDEDKAVEALEGEAAADAVSRGEFSERRPAALEKGGGGALAALRRPPPPRAALPSPPCSPLPPPLAPVVLGRACWGLCGATRARYATSLFPLLYSPAGQATDINERMAKAAEDGATDEALTAMAAKAAADAVSRGEFSERRPAAAAACTGRRWAARDAARGGRRLLHGRARGLFEAAAARAVVNTFSPLSPCPLFLFLPSPLQARRRRPRRA